MSTWPNIEYRSVVGWTDPETPDRDSRYRFKATAAATRQLLRQEAGMLGASDVIVELAVPATSLYKDGSGLRADRSHTVQHVGVVVRLIGTVHGDLRYACDQFDGWEANLRAIALGLEALRKVERYGIGRRGEQYVGWAALPPGTPMGAAAAEPAMTLEHAAAVLAGAGDTFSPSDVLADPDDARAAYRVAAKRYHPDTGGSTETFQKVEEAWRLVQVHHEGRA